VELTPLSSVQLQLPITLICWCFGLVVLGLAILALSFALGVRVTLYILRLLKICKIGASPGYYYNDTWHFAMAKQYIRWGDYKHSTNTPDG
jgi:hypothetical protein